MQFDFPNEEGKPYKSSGGKMVWNDKLKREIPEGWFASSICKIAYILSGGTPSKAVAEYWENGVIPFFGPTDCNGNVFQIETADHITQKGLDHCASSLFEEGTIIITARGSIGKLVVVGTPMAMNQSCYALQLKEGEYEYLYFLTIQLIECLKAKGSGSVFKSIIASDIEASLLCIASAETITQFCKRIKPIMLKIKQNIIEISELTKQRDELLPLLMNGQATLNYDLSARLRVFSTSPCTLYLCHITNYVFSMAKELTDILKAAAEVRDETAMQQNTATRVGGVLTDLAQFVGEAVFAAGMTAKTNAAGVSLLIKYYDADGQPYTKELPLPVASLLRAGVLTPAQLADLNTADRNETTARQASDAELLRRLQGISTSSSAYSDPCINLGGFDHLYAEDGTTIIKRATIVVQETLEAQLQGTMQEVMKYIGKMRGLIYGIPFEAWNFVHRWPNAQQSSIYVQVLHSNFPADAAGDLTGQDNHLHTLSRNVYVYLDADGNFDHSEVSPWRECSLQEADRNNLAAFSYLGAFASMDAAAAKAATIPYAGNADFVLLRFRIGDKGGLILQNVNGASTEQYLFYNGKRYVRYVDFTSADRTAVKTVQAWKLDGVAYIFYDTAKRIIYQRNQWDENISGGGSSTLPIASASYAGLLSNTAFTHLSNFNIYEHSVPTATSVRLVFTKPLTGETGVVTLAAATSARAGVMSASDKTVLDALAKTATLLGTFATRADALNAATNFAIVSNNEIFLLTAIVPGASETKMSVLIFQQVQKNSDGGGQTIQYIHADKKCYTRYINFSAAAVTEVQPVQFDGARNLSLSGRTLQMKNMWGDNVGSSATLPDNGNLYEGTAGTDSVPLVLAKTFGGTATATLAAATSARAGVMTAALYNELKTATANIAAHYEEMQTHLNTIYSRLSAIENRIAALHPTNTQP